MKSSVVSKKGYKYCHKNIAVALQVTTTVQGPQDTGMVRNWIGNDQKRKGNNAIGKVGQLDTA